MKAVIIDYDGVVVDSTHAYEMRSKRAAALFREQWSREFMDIWKNAFLHLTEGKMTLGEYYSKLAQVCEKQVTGAEDNEYMKGERLRYKEMGMHISEIKRAFPQKVKFAVIANYVGRWVEHLLDQDNLTRQFAAIVVSDKAKSRMPDEESYQAILGKLGMRARDCVFISTHPSHLEGAKAAGMTALYFGELDAAAERFPAITTILDVQKYLRGPGKANTC